MTPLFELQFISLLVVVLYLLIGLVIAGFYTFRWAMLSRNFRDDLRRPGSEAWNMVLGLMFLQWPYALYLFWSDWRLARKLKKLQCSIDEVARLARRVLRKEEE
jgi:hypothetical protein